MENSKKNDNVEPFLTEISEKLFRNYRDKARSFERLFYILIGASLFFLFFFLIPYVFIQDNYYNSLKQIREVQESVMPPLISQDATLKSKNAYNQFIQKILYSPLHLKNFIQNNVTNMRDRQTVLTALCDDINLSNNPVECAVVTHVNRMFFNYSASIIKDIIAPLLSVYNKSQIKYLQENALYSPIDTVFLEFNSSSTTPRFYPINYLASFKNDEIEALRDKDPATYSLYKIFIANDILATLDHLRELFIHSIEKNIPSLLDNETRARIVYNNLNNTVNNFVKENSESELFGAFNLLSNPDIKGSFETSVNLGQTTSTLQREELQGKLMNVSKELENLETPFGRIPIQFNTTVTVFPLAIMAVFSICSSFLVVAIRIRKEFHLFYKEKDPSKFDQTDKEIALIAPLPIDPRSNNKISFIILLLPFFIFLAATGLTFYNWILENTLEEPPLNPLVYFPLYVLSSVGLSSESPQSIVDDVIYNYINSPVYMNKPDNIGLNIAKAFHLVNVTEVIENSGIPPVLVAQTPTAPLYWFLLKLIDMNHYNQPLFLFVGLRGVGYMHDGYYYVKNVTHKIKEGEYNQAFTLVREGLGSTTPVVMP